MIPRIVAAALRAPAVVSFVALVLAAAGLVSFRNLDIEVYPNLVPPIPSSARVT